MVSYRTYYFLMFLFNSLFSRFVYINIHKYINVCSLFQQLSIVSQFTHIFVNRYLSDLQIIAVKNNAATALHTISNISLIQNFKLCLSLFPSSFPGRRQGRCMCYQVPRPPTLSDSQPQGKFGEKTLQTEIQYRPGHEIAESQWMLNFHIIRYCHIILQIEAITYMLTNVIMIPFPHTLLNIWQGHSLGLWI